MVFLVRNNGKSTWVVMSRLIFLFLMLIATSTNANAGFVTVEQFLRECQVDEEPCIAFVMGVVEGARHQTREQLKDQPYAFLVHGKPVCLPDSWDSQKLTKIVITVLKDQPQTNPYSAVSGILIALSVKSTCDST